MDLIIGRFLTPLKLLEDDGERPSLCDDNSSGKVRNVRVDSSARCSASSFLTRLSSLPNLRDLEDADTLRGRRLDRAY
jgi:hypothetical protein